MINIVLLSGFNGSFNSPEGMFMYSKNMFESLTIKASMLSDIHS